MLFLYLFVFFLTHQWDINAMNGNLIVLMRKLYGELKGFNPKYSKAFNKDLKSHFAPNKLVYQVIAGGKLTRFIRRYIGLG